MPIRQLVSTTLLVAALSPLPSAHAELVPFDSQRWTIQAEEQRFERYRGKDALVLGRGTAILEDSRVKNGVLEVFVALPDELGFSGPVFRLADEKNYEEFYLRHHQSGNDDANQYSPVFNELSGWQIYYGPRYSTPVEYEPGAWMKLKIVFSGRSADIYLDSDEPILHVERLGHAPAAGALGLKTNGAAVRFADFRFEASPSQKLVGSAPDLPEKPQGLITGWQVSEPFPSDELHRDGQLTARPSEWSGLQVEENGIANLARVARIGDEADTVLARLSLRADRDVSKRVRFGFSDAVHVFLNGRLLYAGSDAYRSRDYRFLGTMGLYDELFLSLEQGRNELVFAVTEGFGGWGVLAQIEDRSGVRVVQ